jgi:hypothetical protein
LFGEALGELGDKDQTSDPLTISSWLSGRDCDTMALTAAQRIDDYLNEKMSICCLAFVESWSQETKQETSTIQRCSA